MISISINQTPRPDVKIQTGGSLERTSQRSTSSTITIEVQTAQDDIRECDYIEFFDGDTLIFAGTILKKDQASVVTMPDWKIYTLSIAGNKDLVSTIFVDMAAPAGATINDILFVNPNVFANRIEPEGITLGEVDDFSYFSLSEPASLWGRYVSDMLDELCSVAGAWWEITPDRVFNMRYQSAATGVPLQLNSASKAFNVQASKDALTFYSACRCVGGSGRGRLISSLPVYGSYISNRFTNRIYQSVDTDSSGASVCKKLVSTTPLWSCKQITQSSTSGLSPTQPAVINVGYKGLDDADSAYQALMTSGGTEIEAKDGYDFAVIEQNTPGVSLTCSDIAFAVDVYARVADPALAESIAAQRGGTGIIEYAIMDDTITDFSTAFSAVQTFLQQNGQRATVISFSQFDPVSIGQLVSVDLPYYGLYGAYQVTKVVASVVLDSATSSAVWQYDIEASNVDYRDPYHDLWNRPVTAKFTLDGEQSPSDGTYLPNTITVSSTITVSRGGEPFTWGDVIGRNWTTLQINWPTWYQLCYTGGLTQEAVYIGNFLTDYGKSQIVRLISGQSGTPFSLFGPVVLQSAIHAGITEIYTPTETAMTLNGGTAIYTISSGEFPDTIGTIYYTDDGYETGEQTFRAGVNIEPPTNISGAYTLVIAIQTSVE